MYAHYVKRKKPRHKNKINTNKNKIKQNYKWRKQCPQLSKDNCNLCESFSCSSTVPIAQNENNGYYRTLFTLPLEYDQTDFNGSIIFPLLGIMSRSNLHVPLGTLFLTGGGYSYRQGQAYHATCLCVMIHHSIAAHNESPNLQNPHRRQQPERHLSLCPCLWRSRFLMKVCIDLTPAWLLPLPRGFSWTDL